MSKLVMSVDLKLPIDAITQRISILGKTRSGKSHTAGVLVGKNSEKMAAAEALYMGF